MEYDDPVDVALVDIAPAKDSPFGIKVLFSGPETMSISAANNSPFKNVDKRFTAQVYEDEFLLETLFPLTRSCLGSAEVTDYHEKPCKMCYWCEEKYWAFGQYDAVG